ncbi:MAG: c-type cytochrome [Owenweeksia sp.]|nr:c-type cytochrome [Owenweeksia sp.]
MDESNVTLRTEGPRLEAGASIYKANCAVCHANDGGGGVGPNLTDKYWIHGGDISDVFSTVNMAFPQRV